ncbi:MAG TPA: hypothetical protein PKI14_13235 [Fervidobacterium sp.]|nr:hypothetical protein [Fervidobacterium sp.]
MAKVSLEDLIVSQSNHEEQPGIIEALLSTIDSIFTNNRMLQRSRLSARHIRGVARVVGTQAFMRARFLKKFNPVIDNDGEITTSSVDNRVLTAVTDSMLAGRISLEGKSRDEIIRIFQAVGGTVEQTEPEKGGLFRRYDY